MVARADEPPATLTLEPIGFVRASYRDRAAAPRQPRASNDEPACLELLPGKGYELALRDLDGWEYLWVLFWFHRNKGWRPMVLPPRSERRRGLFSTRTPHRPNPLGLSVVRLERVEGLRVYVRGNDMLDGTPVLDLKPYVPWADAVPNARAGWLAPDAPATSGDDEPARDPDGRPADPLGAWRVAFAPRAREQLAFLLEGHGLALEAPLAQALALGPTPHPYRRIKRSGDAWVLAHKAWRARFSIDDAGRALTVLELATGYRPEALREGATEREGARPEAEGMEVHRAFAARFGASVAP